MIQAIYLYIKGFGSIIQPVKYEFHKKGLHIIYGENGAGKSTILNALSWVLYGAMMKASKSPEPWEHIQDKTYEGTFVQFKFKKSGHIYDIIRCLNYKGKVAVGNKMVVGGNKVIVLVDNQPIGDKYKKDIKNWIVKNFGYSYNLFKSSIVFGQKMKRLMAEDNATKKKILEETFETAFIQRARESVAGDIKKVEDKKDGISNKVDVLNGKMKVIKEQIRVTKKSISSEKQNTRDKIAVLEKEIEQFKNESESQEMILADFDKRIRKRMKKVKEAEKKIHPTAADNLFKYEMQVSGIKHTQEVLLNEIKANKLKSMQVDRTCKECGSPLKKDVILNMVSKYKAKVEDGKAKLSECQKELQEAEVLLKKYRLLNTQNESRKSKILPDKNKIIKLRMERTSILSNIAIINTRIESHKKRIEEMNREALENLKDNLKNLKSQRTEIKTQLQQLKKDLNQVKKQIELQTWLINDPLSNSGLKAFIFNTMLEKVNHYLKQYKKYTEFQVHISVNLDSAYKDLNIMVLHKDKLKPYEDLSGGQQQLVDFSLAFGLTDAIMEDKPINIMFLDEVFESLTKKNIEKVEQIILNKAEEKSIHLITHTDSFPGKRSVKIELNQKEQSIVKFI